MEPPIQQDINCGGCSFRSEPVNSADHFGHTKCSVHRPCAGHTFWEPQMCTHCTQTLVAIDQQDQNTRLSTIGRLKRVLNKQKEKINIAQPDRQWDYVPILEFRLKKYNFLITENSNVTNYQVYEHPVSDQNQTATSPYDDQDVLQIDHEQDSFDQYEEESSDEDLTAAAEDVNSINNQLQDICTTLHCVNANMSAQCNHPVHNTQRMFSPQVCSTPAATQQFDNNNLNNFGVGNVPSTSQAPGPMLVQPSTSQAPGPMLVQSNEHALNNLNAIGVGNVPLTNYTPRPMLVQSNEHALNNLNALSEHPHITDPITGDTWIVFNEAIHTRIGSDRIEIKTIDIATGFPIKVITKVTFRGLRKELFMTNKKSKTNEIWVENGTAFSAYSVCFDMMPSQSELLPESSYLDSHIAEDSGLKKVFQELMKWTPDAARQLMSATVCDVVSHFEQQCNLFTAHSLINLITGFDMSSKSYARFIQSKDLCVRVFEVQIGAYRNGYSVPDNILKAERMHRLHLFHTLSTVVMMEKYVKKVELISEKERVHAKLCPVAGQGLAKRMLTCIKWDAFHWMEAKLRVRKYLLPNWQNEYCRQMVETSLWDPEIFSDEAWEKFKLDNPGKKVESLLGIRGKTPVMFQKFDRETSSNSSSNNKQFEPPSKKFKPSTQQFTPRTQPKQKTNKRGSRGGKKHNSANKGNKQNYQGNKGQNKPNQNNQGKSFHKGKKEADK